jgi:hypothetical protein
MISSDDSALLAASTMLDPGQLIPAVVSKNDPHLKAMFSGKDWLLAVTGIGKQTLTGGQITGSSEAANVQKRTVGSA